MGKRGRCAAIISSKGAELLARSPPRDLSPFRIAHKLLCIIPRAITQLGNPREPNMLEAIFVIVAFFGAIGVNDLPPHQEPGAIVAKK